MVSNSWCNYGISAEGDLWRCTYCGDSLTLTVAQNPNASKRKCMCGFKGEQEKITTWEEKVAEARSYIGL